MVLILVVVVVAMLSLAGLSYVATVHIERKAVRLHGDELQLESVVGSGIEFLSAFFEQPRRRQAEAGGSWSNPDLFRGVAVFEDKASRSRARFSVVSPRGEEGEAAGIRFGVENESARLNLGVLLRWEQRQPGAGRRALMNLPGMTERIADAILDWIDPDSMPRQFGAEADYYEGLGVPYAPRNAVPQCLEELLLVRGVTRQLLFGADADFNHQVEPHERRAAADRSEGNSSASGPPWASLVTVYSAERNQGLDGRPRVHLNEENLSELYRRLEEVVDRSWARFIVLYRQHGPYQGSEPASRDSGAPPDLTIPARFRIASVLDLVGTKVRVPKGSDQTAEVVASPFSSEPAAMRDYLPKLLDRTSVVSWPVLYGRVNVNLAPREVLRAVPGLEGTVADRIITVRGAQGAREDGGRQSVAWLLTEGLVDLAQMRALLPYLTTGGDVIRCQVVGFSDRPGPSMRAEVVIDAAGAPSRQVYCKNLRLLGRGYPLASLGAETP